MEKLRGKLTYANVMATIAVFLTLGGGAIAATALKKGSVGTKQLKAKAVNEAKLATNAVTQSKIADGAVTKPKIASGAVSSGKIENGAVGLTQSANSLHQKCQSGTAYVIGTCLDTASQSPATGNTYVFAEQACQARGARLASVAELSSLVKGGFGTIPSPLFSWALEVTGPGEAAIVTSIGAAGTDIGTDPHDYRCAFNPLA